MTNRLAGLPFLSVEDERLPLAGVGMLDWRDLPGDPEEDEDEDEEDE